ncbi:Uncharacterized protein APZ42_011497 [Daphnia magna]|uniref:Uncharacterized protein n=1 Tax=Daphnia magna TaxID=35525 RepID=A0A162SPS3_9CRUS|nr:Uncharacterized protein APZ42_011497 [Daphnia magna]
MHVSKSNTPPTVSLLFLRFCVSIDPIFFFLTGQYCVCECAVYYQ